MLGGDLVAAVANHRIYNHFLSIAAAFSAKLIGGTIATALLALSFAVIYYWAPDVKARCWHWLTPGGTIGILGWLLASFGLRIYLHFFNSCLLYTSHFMLLERNLIYTGITRARKFLVVVGQKKALGLAVRNEQSRKRYSGLLSSLKGTVRRESLSRRS